MRRILVTGSRNWSNKWQIVDWLRMLGPGTIVHGDAEGADKLATEAACHLFWPVEKHPANWNKHGKAAGPIRNQEMVDSGIDVCLALPMEGSKGTWDCIRRSLKAGIPTLIVPGGK